MFKKSYFCETTTTKTNFISIYEKNKTSRLYTHRRKWLSLVIFAIALFLWQCHSEDFSLAESNPKRNNSDFFKHDSSAGLTGRAGVDYVSILEDYNDEHNFLATMADQQGMPIWEKMQVLDKGD